jgi:hypothetical protein
MLVIAERFWNGPEHSKAEIREFLVNRLSLSGPTTRIPPIAPLHIDLAQAVSNSINNPQPVGNGAAANANGGASNANGQAAAAPAGVHYQQVKHVQGPTFIYINSVDARVILDRFRAASEYPNSNPFVAPSTTGSFIQSTMNIHPHKNISGPVPSAAPQSIPGAPANTSSYGPTPVPHVFHGVAQAPAAHQAAPAGAVHHHHPGAPAPAAPQVQVRHGAYPGFPPQQAQPHSFTQQPQQFHHGAQMPHAHGAPMPHGAPIAHPHGAPMSHPGAPHQSWQPQQQHPQAPTSTYRPKIFMQSF